MRSSNYHSFSVLIKNFKSIGDLNKIEKRIEKFYDLGLLSEGEFRALDLMILDRKVKHDCETDI